ncbi:hypothetical protein PDK35_10415 [Bacillus cereus group sp. TH153LC]|uniref:hypothetical protein n=1 Tax=Bacillus cereus group sp. TH153LC TaxID=3018059 RepID=UPI0022DF5CEF|nr:hypothetical protein [Bacillus cereus group sp. TH153LC]MDA1660377.1 hypothetical protein [Bacillus cereus group sp. TH153LC]
MPNKNIFKMELAVKLIRLGHDLVGTMPNKNDQKRVVFVFAKTEQLLKDLTEFSPK